jgi:TFIIH basal transcription factor complex TTD-A subunit
LVQCDESIKAIIEKLDKDNNNTFIIDSLDDETMLVASGKINELKAQLKQVGFHL